MAEGAGAVRYVVCRVSTGTCAFPIESARETMRPLPATPLPGTPEFVTGVATVRGEPTPVLDLAALLRLPPGRVARWLVVRAGVRRAALAVDDVIGIRTIDAHALLELPPLLQDAAREHVDRLGRLDAELALVLETARIVPAHAWSGIDRGAASP